MNHPHRNYIVAALNTIPWISLFEMGCGEGHNIKKIVTVFKNKQVGGIDGDKMLIGKAEDKFRGALLKVGKLDDVMLSDNSVDVVLTDRCLSKVKNVDKVVKEIKRLTRRYVVFAEFHSDSWLERLLFWWKTGQKAYDYGKLLKKHGFYDIINYQMPPEYWPGSQLDHIIVAKVTKRK